MNILEIWWLKYERNCIFGRVMRISSVLLKLGHHAIGSVNHVYHWLHPTQRVGLLQGGGDEGDALEEGVMVDGGVI